MNIFKYKHSKQKIKTKLTEEELCVSQEIGNEYYQMFQEKISNYKKETKPEQKDDQDEWMAKYKEGLRTKNKNGEKINFNI